tara:strand:+ start:7140 stop:8243 length:1104 start_codon:yes stop_codon:yes gene_type:complete
MKGTKFLAFYLPQYHPIPENDEWWGAGFTEWRNVAKASPRFEGHYQPHIPADLGFYDLRLSETREAQANMAKDYGIDGFCYYHYWFDGKQVLESPLKAVLSSGRPDFPFCICWANENWTRAWDGQEREVLLKQSYSESDADAHIEHLAGLFSDTRYITVDGKPLVIIYRPDKLPNAKEYLQRWRDFIKKKSSIPGLHIVGVQSGLVEWSDEEIIHNGFDAVLDFQPNRALFPVDSWKRTLIERLRIWLPDLVFQFLKRKSELVNIVNYESVVDRSLARIWPKSYVKYPSLFPSWDNSARRVSPTVIQNLNAECFDRWLSGTVESVSEYDLSNRIVFINAWNEWAEGCHLEPDLTMGDAFLKVVKKNG